MANINAYTLRLMRRNLIDLVLQLPRLVREIPE